MGAPVADLLLLAEPDIDALAWQFTNSTYADDTYAGWPLDRRLEGFLRHRGLFSMAEDGDVFALVLDRVMACIGAVPRPGPRAREAVRRES